MTQDEVVASIVAAGPGREDVVYLVRVPQPDRSFREHLARLEYGCVHLRLQAPATSAKLRARHD
jgi:hypothetical protein